MTFLVVPTHFKTPGYATEDSNLYQQMPNHAMNFKGPVTLLLTKLDSSYISLALTYFVTPSRLQIE